MPRITSIASASALMIVRKVWIRAPSVTPSPFTQVSRTMLAMATSRCGEMPSGIESGAPGSRMLPSDRKIWSLSAGKKTARYLAIATATAAIVPVWITAKSVHP